MDISSNISLKPYNTFGIDVKAKHFISVKSIEELRNVLSLNEHKNRFILGGGSNMLLTKDIEILVIHINLKGIKVISKTDTTVTVKANAGENWHEFILWCLSQGFGGLENLSLIPGNVGTAPIQNIGAYGVELKDTFIACEALNIASGEIITFTKDQCKFDYRNSIFKHEVKGEYIILNVTFQLTKKEHVLKTSYGAITEELKNLKVSIPSIQDVSKAVINIRQSKLPDPKNIGNSGSFFKNPIISQAKFETIKTNFPDIPSYSISKNEKKIPAGWLIEQAGFKGKRFGDFGVHEKQALVLVNYGNASGKDILNLSKLIQETVKRIFNIKLDAEVNII